MGINFPAGPTVGQLHPDPAQAGLPQFKWDGSSWVSSQTPTQSYVLRSGDTMTGALTLPGDATANLHAVPKQQLTAYAAPLDALAYSGMQVNGSMEVSQGMTGGNYVCDNWIGFASAAPGAASMAWSGSGFPIFGQHLLASVTTAKPTLSAGDLFFFQQHIEGYRIKRLAWGTANAQPLTIGFWVWHSKAGTYSVSIANNPTTHSCVVNYTQNVANTPEYKTVTFPPCTVGTWKSDNTIGLILLFALAAGSTFVTPTANVWNSGNFVATPNQLNGMATVSDTFRLTGVVVLPGITAPTAAQSPLIMRPFGEELITCQRYYEKSFDYGTVPANGIAASFAGTATAYATNNARTEFITYRQQKRASPTVVFFSTNDAPAPVAGQWNYYKAGWFACVGTSFVLGAPNVGFQVGFTGTFPTEIPLLTTGGWTADARL